MLNGLPFFRQLFRRYHNSAEWLTLLEILFLVHVDFELSGKVKNMRNMSSIRNGDAQIMAENLKKKKKK